MQIFSKYLHKVYYQKTLTAGFKCSVQLGPSILFTSFQQSAWIATDSFVSLLLQQPVFNSQPSKMKGKLFRINHPNIFVNWFWFKKMVVKVIILANLYTYQFLKWRFQGPWAWLWPTPPGWRTCTSRPWRTGPAWWPSTRRGSWWDSFFPDEPLFRYYISILMG